MRLIDADELIQKRSQAKVFYPDMYVIGQGYVMDAPTINTETIKHGYWENTSPFGKMNCSECGVICKFMYDKYCYNCGTKMDVSD